ncbi:MAG: hypothetical protein GY953_30950 [bacterium]|nr:hypothetical protein [bacterium]
MGRWIHAKKSLEKQGERRPLPVLFHRGGDIERRQYFKGGKGKGKSKEELRVAAVMGLVAHHECEHRAWDSRWGPKPAVGGDGSDGWQSYDGQVDTRFFKNKQLVASIGCSSAGCSIQRPAAGGQEGRDVFVVSLPELLLASVDMREAADIYNEWSKTEIIIGKKPRRGNDARLGRAWRR